MKRRQFLTSAAIGGAATALATPALAQSATEMNIVSTWPRDFPGLGTSAQRLAARIEALTEGRIAVNYFAAGERVGAFDSFDEVASGNSQAYIGADYYWKGKHAGWSPFTAIPMGLTYTEIDAWMKFGGGQELYERLGDEFGLIGFPAGNTGVQMGGWFNKEIESPDDFRGLKIRMPGLGGDVMAKMGASPVSLPGGQIYENLVSGAIDATEWVGPWNDFFLKLYEAAQYYYWPGFHEPGSQLCLGMNKSWWSGLSAIDQEIIKVCCAEENAVSMAEANANNGVYLDRLINEYGVELREFNDDIYEALGEASAEVNEEARDHSPLAAEIMDSHLAARATIGAWTNLSDAPFVAKRNRILDL
ncbi:TRAP transporter substrate-binding protein [Loktanella sp. SALINAS62]|uniref:TRAP transporter substrate-binding protein n=1 Tax=Loktanella sp. SALINAS62 TaxID=2706124 RepID=UPI001B8D55BE|nr:TRAP transporter substrate-binding protein [Loktanella sp. SALINAS62]MBS1302073.1 TRAP transporter substrate-binding protein [Loktanella sp. SALINAS62]